MSDTWTMPDVNSIISSAFEAAGLNDAEDTSDSVVQTTEGGRPTILNTFATKVQTIVVTTAAQPSPTIDAQAISSSPASAVVIDSGSGLSLQTKLCIGIGVGLGTSILLLLIGYLTWRVRSLKKNQTQPRKKAKRPRTLRVFTTVVPGNAVAEPGTAVDPPESWEGVRHELIADLPAKQFDISPLEERKTARHELSSDFSLKPFVVSPLEQERTARRESKWPIWG